MLEHEPNVNGLGRWGGFQNTYLLDDIPNAAAVKIEQEVSTVDQEEEK